MKQKRAHIFESLARLAYNKGTALFRGDNPLCRSVAETFYGSTHPHRHTSHAGCGSDWTRNGNIHAQGWTQEGGCMLKFTQLYLNAAFVWSCWIKWIVRWTPEKYGPEPKECDGKVRYAILSARLSETPAVFAASVGITHETKQSETTQYIIHQSRTAGRAETIHPPASKYQKTAHDSCTKTH